MHAYQQAQLVIGLVYLVDDLEVEGFGCQDAGIGNPGVQKGLLGRGQKAPKDIARAKVDPGGPLQRPGLHGLHIVPRQRDAGGFPG